MAVAATAEKEEEKEEAVVAHAVTMGESADDIDPWTVRNAMRL